MSFSFLKKGSYEDLFIQKSNVNEVIEFESELNSDSKFLDENVSLSLQSIPELKQYKVTKPIIVQRPRTEYLPLYTHYYYTEPDSVVRYVNYIWELGLYDNLFEKLKVFEAEKNKIEKYNKEYERIKRNLFKKLGKPKKEDSSPKETKSKSDNESFIDCINFWNHTFWIHSKCIQLLFEL